MSSRGRPSVPRSRSVVSATAAAAVGVLTAQAGGRWLIAAPVIALGTAFGARRLLSGGFGDVTTPADSRALALALDLISAALQIGLPPADAIVSVERCAAQANNDRLGDVLQPLVRVARLIAWGAEPGQAWLSVAGHPGYEAIAAAASRCTASGARLAAVLSSTAGQLRRQLRSKSLARANRAGVWSLLPLGLCFLPAFVCLGVVPVVGGLAGQLLKITV